VTSVIPKVCSVQPGKIADPDAELSPVKDPNQSYMLNDSTELNLQVYPNNHFINIDRNFSPWNIIMPKNDTTDEDDIFIKKIISCKRVA